MWRWDGGSSGSVFAVHGPTEFATGSDISRLAGPYSMTDRSECGA